MKVNIQKDYGNNNKRLPFRDAYLKYKEKKMKLNNLNIPEIGLGTWLIPNDKVGEVVKNAIDVGYRHIDTAQAYGNEEGIGKALEEINIKREELFITTKVMAEIKNYEGAKQSILDSLKRLRTDYIDLILIHCPVPWAEYANRTKDYFKENLEVWRALEEALEEGKVKAIGVSNFNEADIENIAKNSKIKPMVNQIMCHAGKTPIRLMEYCMKEGIVVESYSPIAHGEADRIKAVNEIALKYHKSFAQICIKYCLELGTVALPKASSREHLLNNLDLNFEISKEDMEYLLKAQNLDNYGKHDFFPIFRKK